MVNGKFVAIAAVALLAVAGGVVAFYTLGNNSSEDGDEGTHTLQDYYGNEFTVKRDVDRAVIESGAALRFVSYMGQDALETIVGSSLAKQSIGTGATSYSYASLPNYTYLSDCSTGNAENIKVLNPDIVIVGCSKGKMTDDIVEMIDLMKSLGIPVCVVKYLDDVTQEDYKTQVRLMGNIFGCDDRAEELISGTDAILKDLSSRMDKMEGTKNVYVGGVSFAGIKDFLWSNVAYGGMMYLDSEKVINSAKQMNPSATYQVELQWDDIYNYQKDKTIDLALLDLGGYELTKSNYMSDSTLYNHVDAIKNGQFYFMLPQTSAGTLHDNTLIAAYAIGSILCPEQFSDVDMKEISEKIWSLFMDSDECGEDVYNGMSSYIKGITGVDRLFGKVPFAY